MPTALDRVIQQALSQVLVPVFDRVQHDALMARVARLVTDKGVLKPIRSYLEAGVMADGVKQPTEEGTPQGSPLSPLPSNVYRDDLDRMLEKRGHRFVRYADDITIYVASKRAAERVMGSTSGFIEGRLKLRVNRDRSSLASAFRATLLGFGFLWRDGVIKVRIDPKARKRLGYWRIAGSGFSPAASPTPTGVSRAFRGSPTPTAVSGMRREPPDADPHVRWCGRGGGKPRPQPDPQPRRSGCSGYSSACRSLARQ